MKLNYTDLRIGNLIYWPQRQSSPDEVHTVRPGDFVTFQKYRFELKGVPITEDWLALVGFTSVHDPLGLVKQYGIADLVLSDNEGNTWQVKTPYKVREILILHSVHQLQNLYHSLTGQELTIKST